MLEEVHTPLNLGMILRCSEAFGIEEVICIMHEDGRFEYATPYDTIEQIVNQWGDAPTRANVLARRVSLASLPAFGPVSLTDLRDAAGVGPANHPRMN